MKEEENVVVYLLRVDEIVNTIKGLGETVTEPMIVQKVLRSLPLRFDTKVSAIEEIKYLYQLTMDELHGISLHMKLALKRKNIKKVSNFQSLKEEEEQRAKIKQLF
jgi:hypothetical protein